jgi:hypothetical protein
MKTFIKPSGVELQVHPDSEAYVLSLGWRVKESEPMDIPVLKPAEPVIDTKRRGRPPKQKD